MYTQTLRQVLLVMHLSGLILMIGTTVTSFVTFRAFINSFNIKREGATGFLKLLSNLAPIKGTGGMLLILSGTGLMFITGGVFLHMLWLQLKLSLILLLLLNEILIEKKQLKKLKVVFAENTSDSFTIMKRTARKLTSFYTTQVLLFLGVIITAVFKFN